MSILVNTVRTILQDELQETSIETFYWVDPLSVLCWIRNVKAWNHCVRNRVSQILGISSREQWFHCPGLENPADLPSRGKAVNLAKNALWWEGLSFFKSDSKGWPTAPECVELETASAMQETMKTESVITHAMIVSEVNVPHIDNALDLQRFSTKGKVLRTIAWVL